MTSRDTQSILDSTRLLVRFLRRADRSAQTMGVSGAQLFVLSELGENEVLSLGELSSRTHTDQSSVSVVVARLVDAGLVSRRKAEKDARRLELQITPRGRDVLDHAPAIAQESLIAALNALDSEDRRRFAVLFRAVISQLDPTSEDAAPMFFEEEPGKKTAKKKDSPDA